MGKYVVRLSNTTATAGNDIITIVSPANRRVRISEISVGGRGTTTAPQEIIVSRSGSGTTGGGALTPSKFDHAEQPAAASTVFTSWSAQPTRDGHGEVIIWNALGGANRWIPVAAKGIEARNGEYISVQMAGSTTPQAMSISVVFEED